MLKKHKRDLWKSSSVFERIQLIEKIAFYSSQFYDTFQVQQSSYSAERIWLAKSSKQQNKHDLSGKQVNNHGMSGKQLNNHHLSGKQLNHYGMLGKQLNNHGLFGKQLR